jgi:CheY-like chemotaxis protein
VTGAPHQILLVEDDEDNRELLAELLQLEGHAVTAVADARGALEAFAALAAGGRTPDVLVADVALPGRMDGLALAREIRRRAPRVAIVAVSGWGDAAELVAARGHEVDAVVTKPADPARLLGALEAAIRARRGVAPAP